MSAPPIWEEDIPGAKYTSKVGPLTITVELGNGDWWMRLATLSREPLDATTPIEAKREGITRALEMIQDAQKMLYQLIYTGG